MAEQFQSNANRYQFYGMIGKGRMGDVYRVMDNFFRIDLAFKTLHPEAAAQPDFVRWFSSRYPQDVNTFSKLGNPNIIKLQDFTMFNGVPAWTMDLLSGSSFQQYCGQPIPYSQAAGLLVPVADALAFAHQRGIIHGNLKPSNILLNSQNQPVLTDWGLTRWLSENGHGYSSFEANSGIGSPEYLAPEQAQGMAIDPRTDIYSLGIIFYELVTGRRPFTAVSQMETMSHQVSDQLPAPRYFAPNISQSAEQLLYQATAKNPMGRISSMGEFALALRNIAADSSNGAYFPPASYYNSINTAADDDDDEGSPMGDLMDSISTFFGSLGHNKNNLIILIVAIVAILGLIIGISVSNSKKEQIEAFNATATSEAANQEATATAIQESLDQLKQATENAYTQLVVASTQSALEAENAAAAAAAAEQAAAVPQAPVEIPQQEVLPTASVAGTGRLQTQKPADGKNFKPGQAFDVNWTVENTGNNTWDLNYKLVFVSGVNFATGQITESQITQPIWPRGAAPITLKCTAPTEAGTYSMQWALTDPNGNTIYSPLGIMINVVVPEVTETPDGADVAIEGEEAIEYIDEEDLEFIDPEGQDTPGE